LAAVSGIDTVDPSNMVVFPAKSMYSIWIMGAVKLVPFQTRT